jgi:hypothetical protein
MRYMIRLLDLEEDFQKQRIEAILNNVDVQFIEIWVAMNREGKCAGFGFVEAHSAEDVERIMSALASSSIYCEKY